MRERKEIQWKGVRGWTEDKKGETQQTADASILYNQLCLLQNQCSGGKQIMSISNCQLLSIWCLKPSVE